MPFNSFDDYPMSWRPSRASLRKPYYACLVDLLEEAVRSGELSVGACLPPQRELADFLDLNPSTVTRAYALARERGLVYGVTGKGTFVAPHANHDLTLTADGVDEACVELGMVTGFNQCDGMVAEAVRTVAQRGYLSKLMDYSNPCGYPHHIEAGRRWLSWKGVRSELARVVERRGLVVIEDDLGGTVEGLDVELGRPVTGRFIDLLPQHTVHIAETTKTLANSLRIAFLACPARFEDRIAHAMFNVNVKTSSLDAEVVAELILNGGAAAIVARKRELMVETNELFDRIFPDIEPSSFPYPLFRWMPIDLPGSSARIEERLRAAGVRVYHGDRFRVSGEASGSFLRVSLSTWDGTSRIGHGLRTLRSELEWAAHEAVPAD